MGLSTYTHRYVHRIPLENFPKMSRKIKKTKKRIFHVSVAFDIYSPQILKIVLILSINFSERKIWFIMVFTIFLMPYTSNEIFVVRHHLRHELYSPE